MIHFKTVGAGGSHLLEIWGGRGLVELRKCWFPRHFGMLVSLEGSMEFGTHAHVLWKRVIHGLEILFFFSCSFCYFFRD